jgi:DNA-binding transcriptional ArsR family regulator
MTTKLGEDSEFCSSTCTTVGGLAASQQSLNVPKWVIEEAATFLACLGEKSRLRILQALQGGKELCVCEIAAHLGLSVATASHHLRLLKAARVLSNRSEGKLVYYRISEPSAEAILDLLGLGQASAALVALSAKIENAEVENG